MKWLINDNWTFQKEGHQPFRIDLPYDAMIHEKRGANCPNGVNTGYFPGGKYVYSRNITLRKSDLNKKIKLHFEGVYQNCKVFINGETVCEHHYGYTPFDVDISSHVREGENELKVTVDNSLEPNCRWYSGSGIYRDVTLSIEDADGVQYCRIATVSINPAVVNVDTDAEMINIYDSDHQLVFSGKPGKIEFEQAQLWSAEKPYLYCCEAVKGDEKLAVRFGIRKLEWNSRQGLLVNGNSVLLRGGCIHHDHGILGACEYRESEKRRIRILKENGFNAIRMAHNPATQTLMDICDEMGMYVMNECYDGWYIPKTYHDHSRRFEKDWQDDLKSMIGTAYNHPSVIMYSIGNEVSETADARGAETCRRLTEYVHSLDDSRPVTAGINVWLNVYARKGMGVYKEKGEYKPEPVTSVKGYKEKKTGSAFFNAMAQKLGALMFYMSKGKKGDDACRDAARHLDIVGFNYASGRYDEDIVNYPERIMVGSETMVRDLPYNWHRVIKYPALIGDFVWSAWDYLGEACIGDWTYHSYKGLPLLAGQGMIDITGKPLASMAYMQVVWGLRKEPFIAVRPLNHAKEKPTTGSWQFTNAIDSWSWDGYEGTEAVVEVYSPGYRVRLSLNGKTIGTKKLKDYKALFKTCYHPGVLQAEAVDENDMVISSCQLVSGNNGVKISVRPEKTEGNLVYVPIEFTDDNGELKPYMEKRIDVKVTGGKLVALGSALCKSDETFDLDHHFTYRGRALAIVKPEGKKTMIIVSSKGYPAESAEVVL